MQIARFNLFYQIKIIPTINGEIFNIKKRFYIKGELVASKSFLFYGISGKPSKNNGFQKTKIKSFAQVVRELFNF